MKRLVIKCGGSIIDELSEDFFSCLKELHKAGYQLVFVHGGGPDIDSMLVKCQIEPVFEQGLRKTTAEVLDIVELMLSGKSNRSLVHKLETHHIAAVGLNGSDGKMFTGSFIDEEALGSVGKIEKVDTELIDLLLQKGISPVLTPISVTEDGRKLNVNADMAAGAVAKAIQAQMCLFVTDVIGVLKNGEILEKLTAEETNALISDGCINGGMIPKVNTALAVMDTGINDVMIVSGKKCFYENGHFIGTKFESEERVMR